MHTHLDWSCYQDAGLGDAYADVPKHGGDFARAVAVCINSGQCEQPRKGVMCPSFRVSGNPHLSPGDRVRLLKQALNRELPAQALKDSSLQQAMAPCVACKGCKRECENNIDMALIKTEYLAQVYETSKFPLRSRRKRPMIGPIAPQISPCQ
ncbi:MAG: 4Fe-4S dicluster domain-containing protein [Candidatus Sedimenticola endophacoides]